jgi:ATP-dependent helicase/nuclease subunit A
MREAQRLMEGIEAIATFNVARGTESLLRMTDDIMRRYTEKKRALNRLDYDDLVYHAGRMMQEDNAAGWVLQKLPGDLKHILVDEAQDTNPDQWQLVAAIAREFFKPSGHKKSANTLFVVGDEKQSIFSFQRADPEEFGRRKKFFADLVTGAGGKWRQVQMEIAFRSSPAITEAVDGVFANPAAADGLFFKEEQDTRTVKHNPFRRGQAGMIELHPVLRVDKEDDNEVWPLPLEVHEETDPATELADKIADQIKSWLDNGEELESRKRPINPADIMILVRRRSAFVDHMVRALKKRDVPVAGADRMSLSGQIVVQDLVALAEVLLFERDDERLGSFLKSPLIGMTEEQLADIAIKRDGFLWDALKAKAKQEGAPRLYRDTYEYLVELRATMASKKPSKFYSSVLMNACPGMPKGSGLAALKGRLGFEAEDPLVEFLNALEKFEKVHTPTLQEFIAWFQAGEAEVKRDISLNAETPRVHIMTVHGAKGLEAPIVFLPDTTGIPSDNTRARPRFLWPMGERTVPLWVPKTDLENSTFTREREKIEQEYEREYRRLLYVAMTRAADRLYVYGAQGGTKLSDKSWYALIRKGLLEQLGDRIELIDPETGHNITADFNRAANDNAAAPLVDPVIRFKVGQTLKAQPDGLKPVESFKAVSIPQWARTNPKADQRPVEKFRPSEYQATSDQYGAPSPLDGEGETYHKQLGTVIHQLFEYLPVLPPEERAAAAMRYLAKPAWGISEKDQKATVKSIMSTMNDPEFAVIFGANSRAEVSITGMFEKDGVPQMMSGQIDRLVVDDKTVTIVDFKNSRKVPKTAEDVQYKYVVQMASYRMALQQIYPDKEIKCALLYTRTSKMIPLSPQKLDAAVAKVGLGLPKNAPPKP